MLLNKNTLLTCSRLILGKTSASRVFLSATFRCLLFPNFYMQEKYEAAMTALSQMEKRAVMAETMLEATKQYQVGQVKANQSFTSRLTSTFQASRSLRLSPADFLSHSLSNSSLQTVHL
ncbi:Ypt/Rab-GAP domain of gyp1p superfamily protein [Zea mays]|uniref:Ypt/Rab-GAP domain of gyp1p superfamily protein n=1 Tax=Zea mays TaxID=4577 RepID=A0A1D6JYV1_MAIZE|nr:Ypt/Rab-GAP domain of gyp1p superfamily protein [Zea mays]